MLNKNLEIELNKQQILPILNTTELHDDIKRLEVFLSNNSHIKNIEITLRQENSFEIAKELNKNFTNVNFGLGSILSEEDYFKGKEAGFHFFCITWEKVTNHSQLRWVGPQKGVTHLAAAAFFNAIWDLISKIYNKPLWRYIIDLETEQLLDKLSFSYIDDVITKKEAAKIIDKKKQNLPSNIDELNSTIFPAYTTAAGWLGYSDDKMKDLVNYGGI